MNYIPIRQQAVNDTANRSPEINNLTQLAEKLPVLTAWQSTRPRVYARPDLPEDPMQGSANLNIMMKAARKAGRSLVKDFREVENLQVSAKGAGDFVSRADIAAEKILKDELMGARPNYGWMAEESAAEEGKDPTRRWIVDPLDGTTNFLHGLPHWAVSIGLEHKGEIVSAVVYDPAKDEMFYAEKGQGAWLNDSQRLRVSARKVMIESIFATGVPFGGKKDLPDTLKDLARLMPACAGVRRWGAAALDLAYVAAGRYEGFWERGLNPWDVAAGILIVREAGGLVEAVAPGEDPLHAGTILAANEPIFDTFARVIRNL
jgi:myo-inositol-1(or 4)-monophosphatase